MAQSGKSLRNILSTAHLTVGLLMLAGSTAVSVLYALRPDLPRTGIYAFVYFRIILMPLGGLSAASGALLRTQRRGLSAAAGILARLAAVLIAATIPLTIADSVFSAMSLAGFAFLGFTLYALKSDPLPQGEPVRANAAAMPFAVRLVAWAWLLAGFVALCVAIALNVSSRQSGAISEESLLTILLAALLLPCAILLVLIGLALFLFKGPGRMAALTFAALLLAAMPFLFPLWPAFAAAFLLGAGTWAGLFSAEARSYYG